MPCSLVEIHHFGGTDHLHLQGRELAKHSTSVLEEYWWTSTELHSITSQKIILFMVITVRISSPTQKCSKSSNSKRGIFKGMALNDRLTILALHYKMCSYGNIGIPFFLSLFRTLITFIREK
jgi:hypothetical protein